MQNEWELNRYVARDRYIRKIQCIYGLVEDKEHCLAALDLHRLSDAVWVDDTSKWPPFFRSSNSAVNNEKASSIT